MAEGSGTLTGGPNDLKDCLFQNVDGLALLFYHRVLVVDLCYASPEMVKLRLNPMVFRPVL
jgi:hypothetical protein